MDSGVDSFTNKFFSGTEVGFTLMSERGSQPVLRKIDDWKISVVIWMSEERAEQYRVESGAASLVTVSFDVAKLREFLKQVRPSERSRYVLEVVH